MAPPVSALHRARELDAQYNIFTDGPAREGIADGEAGLVVMTGEMESPIIIDTRFERGALLLVLSKRNAGYVDGIVVN